jgi:hypothetical protein
MLCASNMTSDDLRFKPCSVFGLFRRFGVTSPHPKDDTR